MTPQIPDWAEKINAFFWLVAVASILILFSILGGDKYIALWMLTFVYGIVGFAVNVGLLRTAWRQLFLGALLFFYCVAFIMLGISLTGVLQQNTAVSSAWIREPGHALDPGFNAEPPQVSPTPPPVWTYTH